MIRQDFAIVNKTEKTNVTERADALRTDIFSLACDMPKQECPPIATQMAESITKIIELLDMTDNIYNREMIKSEVKMLHLLNELALQQEMISSDQFEKISQKVAECQQILFYKRFH